MVVGRNEWRVVLLACGTCTLSFVLLQSLVVVVDGNCNSSDNLGSTSSK